MPTADTNGKSNLLMEAVICLMQAVIFCESEEDNECYDGNIIHSGCCACCRCGFTCQLVLAADTPACHDSCMCKLE